MPGGSQNLCVPITWLCKKHGAVSHSSSEAEVIALDAAIRTEGIKCIILHDVQWFCSLKSKVIGICRRKLHGRPPATRLPNMAAFLRGLLETLSPGGNTRPEETGPAVTDVEVARESLGNVGPAST